MSGIGGPGGIGGKGSENPGNLQQQLLNGLLAFYRNNGVNRAPTGAAFNLPAVGSPTTTTGLNRVANAAMSLSNLNRFDTAVALPLGSKFTASAFCKADWTIDGIHTPVTWESASGTGLLQLSFLTATGVIAVFGVPGGTVANGPSTSIVPTVGQFVHAAFSYDGTHVDVWANGQQIAHSADLGDEPATITSFGLGYTADGPTVAQFCGVWNRVLSAPEIVALFNAFEGFDPTV